MHGGSERERGRNTKNNGGLKKMGINGIGATGYPAWQGARKAQQNASGKNFAESVNNVANAKPHTTTIYLKTDDMLYSGGNGTGLSFYIKYAEDSTEDGRGRLPQRSGRLGNR